MSNQQKFHKKQRQPKKTERYVIGESEAFIGQRENLLANAERLYGKVEKKGKNILYTVGSEQFGYIEYFIVNATLPDYVYEQQQKNEEDEHNRKNKA